MSPPCNSRAASRRKFLYVLTAAPLALSVSLFAGCSNAIPPREYQRPRSHIVGGNGKRGRSRGTRDGSE
jgi:hypothetical protein